MSNLTSCDIPAGVTEVIADLINQGQKGNLRVQTEKFAIQSNIGSTYSVKYLGIVDGAMGILSRKMTLQGN